jgi:hypothetical protein
MLKNYDYIDLNANPDYQFIPGDRYLIFEKDAYNILVTHQGLHIGPRREKFHEMTKCPYMILRNGVIFKFKYLRYERRIEWLTEDKYNEMLPHIDSIRKRLKDAELVTGISKRTGKPYYRLDFKDVADVDKDVLRFLVDENYVKPQPKVKGWKVVQDSENIKKAFEYFTNQEVGNRFGLDYETNGFPFDDSKFFHMGVGIADQTGICAYFDMEWMQSNEDKTHWNIFLEHYKNFLDKHQNEIYTYNVGFELRCTYLLFKHMYPFHDAGVINKLEGDVEYYHSLKYTAMKYLGVASWDDNFEWLTENLDVMMNGIYNKNTGNYERDPLTLQTYQPDEIWKQILKEFPNDIPEFKLLFNKYWGDPFKCIPSNILGEYCSMDSYYTLLLRFKSDELGYTDKAWNCFNNNMRLGAHLEINGAYIDEEYRQWMHDVGHYTSAYGCLNIDKLFIKMELENLGEVNLIEIPEVTSIVSKGLNFTNGNSLIRALINESYEDGIDLKLSYESLGESITNDIIEIIKRYYEKVTHNIFRARKVFGDIENYFKDRWNYQIYDDYMEFTIEGKFYKINSNLNNILYRYNLIEKQNTINNYLSQMHPNTIKTKLKDISGKEDSIEEIEEWGFTIFNSNSPLQIGKFLSEYHHRMRNVMYNLFNEGAAWDLLQSNVIPQLDSELLEKFKKDSNLCLTYHNELRLIEFVDKTKDLIANLKFIYKGAMKESDYIKVSKDPDSDNITIEEIREHYNQYFKDNKTYNLILKLSSHYQFFTGLNLGKKLFELFDKFVDECNKLLSSYGEIGWIAARCLFDTVNEWDKKNDNKLGCVNWLSEHLAEFNIEDKTMQGLAKFAYCYRSMRKYGKVTSTYVDGMFAEAWNCYDYDENGVSIGRWGEGKSLKAFPSYMVMCKKSKRWSSNFHTIPSKNECKRIVTTPPGYLLSYFDISGLEVRTLAFLSNDEFILKQYELGLDPYIELGRSMYPNKDEKFYREIRGNLKIALLGSLYGMGSDSMGYRMEMDANEAEELLQKMFEKMWGVKAFIEKKGTYPFEHEGRVDTILGDKLSILDEPEDRWARLGNNLVIQGGSAILMGDAFENIIQDSYDHPKTYPIVRPMNVVHDSAQNYFESNYIFDIHSYYHERLTEYLYKKFGIRYEFDTLVGVNYFDMAELRSIDNDTLQLTGNYRSLTSLCRKLKSDNVKFKILSIKHAKEDIEYFKDNVLSPEFCSKVEKDFVKQFYIGEMESIYEYDYSKFRMIVSRK